MSKLQCFIRKYNKLADGKLLFRLVPLLYFIPVTVAGVAMIIRGDVWWGISLLGIFYLIFHPWLIMVLDEDEWK